MPSTAVAVMGEGGHYISPPFVAQRGKQWWFENTLVVGCVCSGGHRPPHSHSKRAFPTPSFPLLSCHMVGGDCFPFFGCIATDDGRFRWTNLTSQRRDDFYIKVVALVDLRRIRRCVCRMVFPVRLAHRRLRRVASCTTIVRREEPPTLER